MGATSLGNADEEELNLNCENDKEYLELCGIMALQDEITRGSALRDLKSKLGSLNAGVRKRPKMVESYKRKAKRKIKPCKINMKCHNPDCKTATPCPNDDICMIDNIFAKPSKGKSRNKRKPRRRERKCKEICPLGVLELAVPSKRLCIETWRQYSHVLPPYAITRLKEIILDQKPIIEVSAAVECFNLHRKKCKKQALKRKKEKLRRMLLAKNKKKVPNRISRICAKLARETLNYLKTPKVINLDSDWQRLAQVIYTDMRKMLKQTNAKHLMNRNFLKDAAKKGAVWIGTILEQYEDMLVYEEIRDLEEIEGPVLDIIEDILNAVLEICEPTSNNVFKSESAINYFSGDISLAGEAGTRKGSHATYTSKVSDSDVDHLVRSSDWNNKHGLFDRNGTHKLGIKLEKDYDLDSDVRRDIIETAGEVTRSITDMAEAAVTKSLEEMEVARKKQLDDNIIVLAKPRHSKSSESEVEADKDQVLALNNDYEKDPDQISAGQTAKSTDNINKELDEMNKNVDEMHITVDEMNKNVDDMNRNVDENAENNQVNVPEEGNVGEEFKEALDTINLAHGLHDSTNQETIDALTKREVTDNIPIDQNENMDTKTMSNKELEKDPGTTSQSNNDGKLQPEKSDRRNSYVTFTNKDLKIGPINDDLLSNADETWPHDIPFPVVKPSVSVTQSITTLGNITESEETVKGAAELTKQSANLLETDNEDKPEKTTDELKQPIESGQDKAEQLTELLKTDEEGKQEKPTDESQEPLESEQDKAEQLTELFNTTNDDEVKSEKADVFELAAELDKLREKTAEESQQPNKTDHLAELSTLDEFAKTEESKEPKEFITLDIFDKDLPSVSKPKESEDLTKPAELILTDSTQKEIKEPYKPKGIQQLLLEMDRDMKNVETKRQKKQIAAPRKSPDKHSKAPSPTRKDTKTIFDYKVRPETAPSWLLKRVCSCRTVKKEYDPDLQTCVLKREQMMNVFKESDNLVKCLELWNRWIASTCEQIITLKENSDAAKYVEGRCSANRCIIRQWRQLQTNINQATEQWSHCKTSTQNRVRKSQHLFSKY